MCVKTQKGFTLIELLVVIAIIGILSSVVLASLGSVRRKSRDTRRISDIKQLQIAIELYQDNVGGVPTQLDDASLVTAPNNFIAAIPADPSSGDPYYYEITSSGYHLGADLEGDATDNKALLIDLDTETVSISGSDDQRCNDSSGGHCYDVGP